MLTKTEAARKLADLVSRLKLCSSFCPHSYGIEIELLTQEINLIENELDKIIDDMQATKFERYFSLKRRLEHESSIPHGQLLGIGNKDRIRGRKKQNESHSEIFP